MSAVMCYEAKRMHGSGRESSGGSGSTLTLKG